MSILISAGADPNMVLLIDIDAMLQLRPFVSRPRASPGRNEIAVAIELQYRRRSTPDRSGLVGLQRGWTMSDPHVIAFIHGDTDHCADDPMIWQGFRPRWIY